MASLPVPLNQDQLVHNTFERWSKYGPASLPVQNPTLSFWTDSAPDVNPMAKEGSEGALTADADVCIIGSGITGVSVAYHLARLGLIKADSTREHHTKIAILEARDFCSGATGRNGGHMTAHGCLDFASDSAAFGIDEAKRAVMLENYVVDELAELIRAHGLQESVDFSEGGRTILMFTDAEMMYAKSSYESAKQAGLDTSGKYGPSYPAVHIMGRNVWPLKLVTHLYHLSKDMSPSVELVLHTHTPVTAIHPTSSDSSRKWALQTPRGTLLCSFVVHATNGYTSHLLPQFAGPNSIVPVRGQVIATRASVDASQLTDSGFAANEGFEYWFPRPVADPNEKPLIILGGGREAAGSPYEMFTTDDSILNPAVGKVLREFLPSVFPKKFESGTEPGMEWTGIMGFTPNHDPFVGPVLDFDEPENGAFDGQFISAGYSGHGMPRAYACAETVARMIAAELNGTHEWDIPDWLPRHYLTKARISGTPLTRREAMEIRQAMDAETGN